MGQNEKYANTYHVLPLKSREIWFAFAVRVISGHILTWQLNKTYGAFVSRQPKLPIVSFCFFSSKNISQNAKEFFHFSCLTLGFLKIRSLFVSCRQLLLSLCNVQQQQREQQVVVVLSARALA